MTTLAWPGDKGVAFYLGLNLEHFTPGKPAISVFPRTAGLDPDVLNQGWRDYGARAGIWRIVESLDRRGVPVTALVNAATCLEHPEIVRAGVERGWAWVAHGWDNSTLLSDLPPEEEAGHLREAVETIARATGSRPRGWLGPALTQTHRTPALLAGLGLEYVLDWCNDDRPYWLDTPGLLSVPFTVEVNDLTLFVLRGHSGPELVRVVEDQVDQLRREGGGRVMALALHPFVTGQAFRQRYLDEALDHLLGLDDVWVTTADEIAAAYAARCPAPAPASPMPEKIGTIVPS
ncbi:polysaccharide deacetylase family protein [Nocardioides soli]|uniref:Peptidoglycan/xylan/chitin deacetylase (PgdA/CDA1 family) n=1 Tax=Nocardioides soli TaxID=1036020 RepID=A0A7W4Z3U0_9ACTN|nr:polysaccharide deacetylase family protein [Nocardioides soli]MBB3045347.1 peptidoglycan/xylan/chitin deacetylase (PgdA/CDA1 family) [Nocardioides soli]